MFLDFEYFGWDDPVKLTADFLLHPAMKLERPHRAAFLRGMVATFGNTPWFLERLRALYPLYALRWATIVLNPFLPERRARLEFAGARQEHDVLRTQRNKALRLVGASLDLEPILIDED